LSKTIPWINCVSCIDAPAFFSTLILSMSTLILPPPYEYE